MMTSSSASVVSSVSSSFSVAVQEFDPTELVDIGPIGNGTTSTVTLALHNGLGVAVKTLKSEDQVDDMSTRRQMKSDFNNELSVNVYLRHPNIIMLLGCVMSPPHSPNLQSLVFEYCNGGTLACESYGLGRLTEGLNISIGIARALCHAHALGIMHRDVKPSQVVLTHHTANSDDEYIVDADEMKQRFESQSGDSGINANARSAITSHSSLIPKLGDWGLATFCKDARSLTGQTGTWEFMAPEIIRRDSYGTSADVFSFGVFLFCVICGKEYPFEDLYLTPAQAALGVAKNQLRPKLPSRIPNTVSQIITMCWATDPASRPTMDVVVAMLLNALRVQRRKDLEKKQNELGTTSPQQTQSQWWLWGSSKSSQQSSTKTNNSDHPEENNGRPQQKLDSLSVDSAVKSSDQDNEEVEQSSSKTTPV